MTSLMYIDLRFCLLNGRIEVRNLTLEASLSALDSQTEAPILSNINDVLAGRSGLIISHRGVCLQRGKAVASARGESCICAN